MKLTQQQLQNLLGLDPGLSAPVRYWRARKTIVSEGLAAGMFIVAVLAAVFLFGAL